MSIQSLTRSAFTTSRTMDFFSETQLEKELGHGRSQWPCVIIKELIDNSLDACEEHGIAPEIDVTCDGSSIEVSDNGGGIPEDVVVRMLDFTSRTSSRAEYVAPDRGAQGNALKTLIGIAHVLGGRLVIESRGVSHQINVAVDSIRQDPSIRHVTFRSHRTTGTSVRIDDWPQSESDYWLMGTGGNEVDFSRIWWLMFGFAAVNPHLAINLNWFGELRFEHVASNPSWQKWKPCQPTSAHWYEHEHLLRLAAAYINAGEDMLVRDFVGQFDGLSRTAKRKAVLDAAGLQRAKLSDLVTMDSIKTEQPGRLLKAMQNHSQPVKPKSLGIIGRDHLTEMLQRYGGADSIRYRKAEGYTEGQLPYVLEMAFARLDGITSKMIVSAANFSAGINDLFGRASLWADDLSDTDPVLILTHLVSPRLQFADSQSWDLCRITRVPGSINGKASKRVEYWIRTDEAGHVATYLLDDIAGMLGVTLQTYRKDSGEKSAERQRAGLAGYKARWLRELERFHYVLESRSGFREGTRWTAVWIYLTILRRVQLLLAKTDEDIAAEMEKLWARLDQPGRGTAVREYTRRQFRLQLKRKNTGANPSHRVIADGLRITRDEAEVTGWPEWDMPVEQPMTTSQKRAERQRWLRRKLLESGRQSVPSLRDLQEWLEMTDDRLRCSFRTIQTDLETLGIRNPRRLSMEKSPSLFGDTEDK